MSDGTYNIGIVAPGAPIDEAIQNRLLNVVQNIDLGMSITMQIHPQCLTRVGHFAGDDAARADAFLQVANDPKIDAVWVARGGYGACRILDSVISNLSDVAKAKTYLGYSDAGFVLGALYQQGFSNVAHGPMPADLLREGGEEAIRRSVTYFVSGDTSTLAPRIANAPAVAFNMTILNNLLGTPYAPDLSGHILMLEEVSEYHYAMDRMMFHITNHPNIRGVAGIALGRCSEIPENDYPFEKTEEQIVEEWCARSGITYLGRADIGHDVDNKIVAFGQTVTS